MGDDKQKKEEKFGENMKNGPIENRSCTDCLCCLIFVVFFVAMGAASIYGYSKGNP